MNEGQFFTAKSAEEFSEAIATLRVVEPLQMLITEPSSQSIPLYYQADISPHYGIYTENSLGAYDYQQTVGPSILVSRRNGVVIKVNNFIFEQDLRLSSVTIQVLSNQNGIATPATETFSFQLTQQWLTNMSTRFAPGLSTGLRIVGSATYPNQLVIYGEPPTKIEISREYGYLEEMDPLVVPLSLRVGQRLVITDLTNGPINKKTLATEHSILYVPSDLPGVWVASSLADTFLGVGLHYDARLLLTSSTVAANDQAEYKPQGGATLHGKSTAKLAGGPWQCAISNPLAIGAGTKIYLEWLGNQALVDIFPSPAHNCAQMIITEIGF